MAEKESFGWVETPDGKREELVALFRVFRDEREVLLLRAASGALVVETKSWLRENNHQPVRTRYLLTEETFAMLMECCVLGCQYFGIDMSAVVQRLHGGPGGVVRYEYGGCGVPDFSAERRTGDVKGYE